MAKKPNCPSITKKDIERLRKFLKQNIETGELTDAEIESAITKLMTEKDLTIDELLKSGYRTLIANAIGAARSQKSREDEVLNNTKIGNAEVNIGKEVKKSDPQKNRDILYIFTDNLQAYNTLAGSEDKVFNSSLLSPKEVTVNVGRTSALMRTDTAGEKNRNALGLVTKKNAQDKEGKWLTDSGNFEDTDEDYHSFIQANRRVIAKIKDALTKEGSEYKEVILPKTLAIENSGLPKRFVEALQNMLEKELGIPIINKRISVTPILWDAYNFMQSRVPATDWYYTITGQHKTYNSNSEQVEKSFRNRTVVGGHFIKLLEYKGIMKL